MSFAEIAIYSFITTHITIVCVSLYLHRYLTHRQFTLHPILEHAMRFWLWFADGVVSKPWVAQHRKHHKYTDVHGDPHSPVLAGNWQVTLQCMVPNFIRLYQYFDTDWALEHYGRGTPDDWLEKNIYGKLPRLGLILFLIVDILIFGFWVGLAVWVFHLFYVPFFSTACISGFAHWFGYKHKDSPDNSRNLFPIGIIISGDELHNNHHKNPSNPNFAHRWFEFDIGYMYLKIFEKIGLLKLK